MPSSPSANERLERLLIAHGLRAGEPDETLQAVVSLASAMCEVPAAAITFVADERPLVVAHVGCDDHREGPVCAHAIASGQPLFVVPDARLDPRFAAHPAVTSVPGLVFYASVPIDGDGGRKIGTLCVLDGRPRELTRAQEQGLARLAHLVTQHLRSRRESRATADAQEARAQAERALARSEFLLAVATALNGDRERRSLLRRLLAVIAPSRADLASLWAVLPGGLLQREAHWPDFPGLEATGDAQPRAYDADFPIRRVVDRREPLRVNQLGAWIRTVNAPAHAALVDDAGLGHALYLPITHGDEVVGVLSVSRRSGEPFSDEDEALFTAVATQTGLALEQARLVLELATMRDAAEAATRAKDRFLALVSHDLRNPIGTILGWANLLRESGMNPARLGRGLEVIERNAVAQLKLLEDLLDVSRIAEGKLTVDLEPEAIAPLVDEALDAARVAAGKKGVRLAVDLPTDLGSTRLDRSRFRQVLWNLASNAVKFTPPGGTVAVRARRDGDALEIAVADTGRGIAPDFLPRAFEAFEQDPGASRTGGLGLGLAIARTIVELHGGTITAASEGEGRGATFTVRVPTG